VPVDEKIYCEKLQIRLELLFVILLYYIQSRGVGMKKIKKGLKLNVNSIFLEE